MPFIESVAGGSIAPTMNVDGAFISLLSCGYATRMPFLTTPPLVGGGTAAIRARHAGAFGASVVSFNLPALQEIFVDRNAAIAPINQRRLICLLFFDFIRMLYGPILAMTAGFRPSQ